MRLPIFSATLVLITVLSSAGLAEVKFPTKKLFFKTNKVELTVQIAETFEQRAHGLMNRPHLADTEGMLFVSEDEVFQSFWMKNTLIPLSIGFFDKNRKLIQVLDMQPPLGPVDDSQLPSYRSAQPAKYALEVSVGWFKRKNIAIGSVFEFNK